MNLLCAVNDFGIYLEDAFRGGILDQNHIFLLIRKKSYFTYNSYQMCHNNNALITLLHIKLIGF